jgi:hypothetical protein
MLKLHARASQNATVTSLNFLDQTSETRCGAGTSGALFRSTGRVLARKNSIFAEKRLGAEKNLPVTLCAVELH